MTCKDCVHYEVCKDDVELYRDSYDCLEVDGVEKNCEYFKPKSRFVELPCEVGQKIYKIWSVGKHGRSIAEFVVKHIDIDFLPNIEVAFISEKTNSGNYRFAIKEDFGKTVFLSREDAEKALAERSKE